MAEKFSTYRVRVAPVQMNDNSPITRWAYDNVLHITNIKICDGAYCIFTEGGAIHYFPVMTTILTQQSI